MRELKRHGKKRNVQGMAHYGIRARKVFGVSKPDQDAIARKIGKNHALGEDLWKTGFHDARILGMLISEAERVTPSQMERWVKDFDNWDVCDGTCCHLFVDAAGAWEKAFAWSDRKKEFEKRAGFALAAFLGVHDKEVGDAPFRKFLGEIERQAIFQALRKHDFNRTETAKALGISRRALIYKLQRFRELGYEVDPSG